MVYGYLVEHKIFDWTVAFHVLKWYGDKDIFSPFGYHSIRNSSLIDDEIIYDVKFPNNIVSPSEPSKVIVYGDQTIQNNGIYQWTFMVDKTLPFGYNGNIRIGVIAIDSMIPTKFVNLFGYG